MTTYSSSSKKGAALLMAVFMASIMLSVGLGVYQRTYKELYFASFWKQAQIAFAAADAGFECALYWDLHRTGATSANCFGSLVPGWNPSANTSVNFSITTPFCVTVEITKNAIAPFTTIQSRGLNTCDSVSPRVVERGLRIDY